MGAEGWASQGNSARGVCPVHLPRWEAIHFRRALLRSKPAGRALHVRKRGGTLRTEERALRGAAVQG